MGLVAARMADAATSVRTHIFAIFFISFSLSFFVLSCSLYYEVRAALDERLAFFNAPGSKGGENRAVSVAHEMSALQTRLGKKMRAGRRERTTIRGPPWSG
jgi:hypothetical protein